MDRENSDTKVCATDIKIGARISIAGLVKAAIDFTMSRVNKEAKSYEEYGASSATGNLLVLRLHGDMRRKLKVA